MKINRLLAGVLTTMLVSGVFLAGCSTGPSEHYTSPRVKVESQKINLEEVQKAFWESKGKDLSTWMAAFEKRVNEIYDGEEVVSVDATRKDSKLLVTGYIDKVNKEGFQPGDEKLFSIEQTGDAVNNEMPYRMSGYDNNHSYYEGHHGFLDNPFLQAFLISHLMGGWGGGHYYTPRTQVVVLRDYRSSYRQTPTYTQQKTANEGFFSRFKRNSSGGMTSSKSFGGGEFSSATSGTKSRTFGGSGSTLGSGESTSSSSSSGWAGRRSSSTSLFGGGGGGMRRSWGGRRR